MSIRLFASALLLFSSCSEEKKAVSSPPPEYHTLHRAKFNGAIFQFAHEGGHYLACSIHQGAAAPGAEVFRQGDSNPVTFEKRVHKQKDLHVWTYSQENRKQEHVLIYTPDPKIEVGDRIYFLNKGQKIAATVVGEPEGKQFRYLYETDEVFVANGMSGSPVFLPRTGSVIGVLQTANNPKRATMGGFELLEMK